MCFQVGTHIALCDRRANSLHARRDTLTPPTWIKEFKIPIIYSTHQIAVTAIKVRPHYAFVLNQCIAIHSLISFVCLSCWQSALMITDGVQTSVAKSERAASDKHLSPVEQSICHLEVKSHLKSERSNRIIGESVCIIYSLFLSYSKPSQSEPCGELQIRSGLSNSKSPPLPFTAGTHVCAAAEMLPGG